MTGSAPAGLVTPSDDPTVRASLLAIAAAVAVILAGDVAVVVLVFFAWAVAGPFALLVVPLVTAGAAAVLALVMKAVTGRSAVAGGIVVALLHTVLAVWAVTSVATADEAGPWLLFLALAALCALALGLFLGPRALRIAGALAVVVAVVLVAAHPTPQQRIDAANAERQASELAEWRASFLAAGTFPYVSDLDGWRAAQVRATGVRAESWLVDDAGAVATVLATGPIDPAGIDPATACSFLVRDGDVGAAGPDELPAWCAATGPGWARPDGLGLGFARGDRYVVVRAGESADIAQAGGSVAASPSELQRLAGSLRPMDRADVEREVLDSYSGDLSPVVVFDG